MTFFLKKEMLRTKSTRIVFVLVAAAAVIFGGYVLALAVLAPEQLAEATVTASDVVCSGCVGNSDIAPNAVGSGKIADGQVKAADIATDAVTAAEIGSSQVGNSEIADDAVSSAEIEDFKIANIDIADSAVTSRKILDNFGVYSVDITDGQVRGADIGDGQVSSLDIKDRTIVQADMAFGAIQVNVQRVEGSGTTLAPDTGGTNTVDCPPGTILTGGGFGAAINIRVQESHALDANTWEVGGYNENPVNAVLRAYALCIDPSQP
jgi:hypothetical protein